jgi:hypothetical protein
MARTSKSVKKISDKLVKVGESFTINMYDNGYMIEIGGRDSDDDWSNAKIMCSSLDDLIILVKEACEMERKD